jgi:hypothetical protein
MFNVKNFSLNFEKKRSEKGAQFELKLLLFLDGKAMLKRKPLSIPFVLSLLNLKP